MASHQLNVHTVKPKDFTYTKGEWILPLSLDSPALLLGATQVEATSHVDLVKKEGETIVTFVLVRPIRNYGWEEAELCIGAKLGEAGKDQFENITREFLHHPTGTKMHIARSFSFAAGHETLPENRLFIGLFDRTETPKGGLELVEAKVY